MKKYKIGIIGLGYWGPNLVRNFHKHDGFEIRWGCDLMEQNLIKSKKEFPFVKYTKNINNLIQDKSISLIALATPPETHYFLGKKILESGKHLWIEKPFTNKYEHADGLSKIAKNKNLLIHVDFPFIFHGPVIKIKEMLEKNKIGKPLYYSSVRSNLGLIQKGVDVIWDLAPHDLSILFYLFPKLVVNSINVSGSKHIGNSKYFQIANLVLKCEDRFMAYIYLSWLSPVKFRLTTIGGRDKMILFDDIEPTEKIKLYDKNVKIKRSTITPFNPVYRVGDVLIPTFDQTEALLKEIDYLYNNLLKPKKDYYTLELGLKVLEVLEKTKELTESGF
jgi:predicted dehydrogenase